MPPHCDSKDGPVVKAATKALEAGKVEIVLPFVKKNDEDEVRRAFDLAMKARILGADARQVADLYFFENVVRLHRKGEGAAYTGLKPAGLDVGPVIPLAEKAIESGSPERLAAFLADTVMEEVHNRLEHVNHLKLQASAGIEAAREYTEAMLGLQVWSHALYTATKSSAHEGHAHHD